MRRGLSALLALPLLVAGQPTEPAVVPAPAPAPVATPAPPAPPALPTVAAGTECTCGNGAVLKGTCYPDLAAAIAKSTSQDTVYVVGTSYVKAPIHFGWDLFLVGKECDGNRYATASVDAYVYK